MIPPAKLDRDPCKLIPTATPADASTVSTEVIGTPNMEMMEMTMITYNTMFTQLVKKDATVGSRFCLFMIFVNAETIFLMTMRPIINTSNARSNFAPALTAMSWIVEIIPSMIKPPK